MADDTPMILFEPRAESPALRTVLFDAVRKLANEHGYKAAAMFPDLEAVRKYIEGVDEIVAESHDGD